MSQEHEMSIRADVSKRMYSLNNNFHPSALSSVSAFYFSFFAVTFSIFSTLENSINMSIF